MGFHEFTHEIFAFHASRMDVISRIHATKKGFSRFHATKKGVSRNHATLWGGGVYEDNLLPVEQRSRRFYPRAVRFCFELI